jgi:nitrate reductase gamma subunit
LSSILTIMTYFSYIFIVTLYAVKVVRIARMPVHLRWELYPVLHETERKYGGSYYEDLEWWKRNRQKGRVRGILFLLKDNFSMGEYFHRNRAYWLVLLPWHIGFIFIIVFHVFCFFGALAMVLGLAVSPESSSALGRFLYFSVLVTGGISFITGTFGSVGMAIKRLSDEELRTYASPQNYFNYLFTLVIFLSGLYAWYFVDPTLSEYRQFWRGLITLKPMSVETAAAFHILAFALFLIYLPFTRSIHYITKFFAYLWIRWDDRPNVPGSKIERMVEKCLNQPVSWSAPHIQSGNKWAEVVSKMPTANQKEPKGNEEEIKGKGYRQTERPTG